MIPSADYASWYLLHRRENKLQKTYEGDLFSYRLLWLSFPLPQRLEHLLPSSLLFFLLSVYQKSAYASGRETKISQRPKLLVDEI